MPGDPYTVHWREDMPPDIVDTEVLVGFLAHGNTGLVTYPNTNLPVAQVAVWNEFGRAPDPSDEDDTGNPPRPFISFSARLYAQRQLTGTPEDVGREAATIMSNVIRDWTEPPNSERTVRRKGFNDPLIETRLMMNSTDYLVVNPSFAHRGQTDSDDYV